MTATLATYPVHGLYGLTHTNVPVSIIGDSSIEHREPGTLALFDARSGFEKVTRFEFLAHLAARGESRLCRLGTAAIAVRGFAGGHGWAFRRTSKGPSPDGVVRPATEAEHDAAEFGTGAPIARAEFADRVCYGQLNDPD